jgi:hypothetical protein
MGRASRPAFDARQHFDIIVDDKPQVRLFWRAKEPIGPSADKLPTKLQTMFSREIGSERLMRTKLAVYALIVALAIDGTAFHYRYAQAAFQHAQHGGELVRAGLSSFMAKLLPT